jgi:hypothetical protein
MDKESLLYDSLIDYFIDTLRGGEISDKELKVITDFVTSKDIGANPEKHEKTKELANSLPFEEIDEEFGDVSPLRIIK